MALLGNAVVQSHREPETIAALLLDHARDHDQMVRFLQEHFGNQYTLGVLHAADQLAQQRTGQIQVSPEHADATIESGHAGVARFRELQSRLFPAYRRAIDALDPGAALELATHLVQSVKQIEATRDEVVAVSDSLHTAGTAGDPGLKSWWLQLVLLRGPLTAEFGVFAIELATKIGPQVFRDQPVLGTLAMPRVGKSYADYLANEAGTSVELLALVRQIREIAGPSSGEPLTPQQRERAAALVHPLRSRPVNFAFVASALTSLGIWQQIASEEPDNESMTPKTLDQERAAVVAQAAETGPLNDVRELDADNLRAVLGGLDVPSDERDTLDERASAILEQLYRTAPVARSALVKQIQRMGYLPALCKHLPRRHIEALHDSLPDADGRILLNPYIVGEGGGRSMHQIYMDAVDDKLKDGATVQAYALFALDRVHNFATAGFMHDQSAAYDAREQGLITDDAYVQGSVDASAKAAIVTGASVLTGGAAGKFGEGAAAALGAGRLPAQIIGGASGGFGAGVGGHFAGDVYAQQFEGKDGFDSPADYVQSGLVGTALGSATSAIAGLSVNAGKYLGDAKRPIDRFAERAPGSAGALERIRAAGFAAGNAASNAAIRLRMTASEARALVSSGLARLGPRLAIAGADLDTLAADAVLEVALKPRPMQASRLDDGGHGFDIDDLELLGEGPSVDAMKIVKGKRAIGAEAKPKHHAFPQEDRAWFEEHGFVGDRDIDNFCIELERSDHEALHGGGNWRLGRTWPNEWNKQVMARLRDAERRLGRRLTFEEVKATVEAMLRSYNIEPIYVRYR